MLMFTLAISCLTTSNLPRFMDITYQVPMQYFSLQHQTLLPWPVTSTSGWFFFVCLFFSHWLHLFILSRVLSPLITSSILGTYQPQFSSFTQVCSTLCDSMNHSTPGLPVRNQLPEFTQTHVHRVIDAIQPSHPLSSPSPPAPNPSQHQTLFQWVNSSHEVAKILQFQL